MLLKCTLSQVFEKYNNLVRGGSYASQQAVSIRTMCLYGDIISRSIFNSVVFLFSFSFIYFLFLLFFYL